LKEAIEVIGSWDDSDENEVRSAVKAAGSKILADLALRLATDKL